ncbi:MAG: APC family permease [Acidobacteria bacterium]|nr:APC family permease [Acidobacteriota bacterium]
MPGVPPPGLRRSLSLGDLIFYGIVLIQPIAPVGIFGIASRMSRGHAVTTILIAMVAMMLTAWSYGRMATRYPAAGSAYTYVSHGLNPHLGFLAGWAMFLDYLIIPVINTIYVALTIQRLAPQVPFFVWAALTAVAITVMNLRSIGFTARANQWLLAVMSFVIVAFVVLAVRFLFSQTGLGGVFAIAPFYDAQTFHPRAIATATSLAALTYIGFDGVTTLAEEVRDPKRTVPLATVLVCLITGILSAVEIYLAQRVWPDYTTFANLETAFLDVTGRVGGDFLFQAMALVLIVACFGSGLAGQAGAARLLFGMGRDQVLPRKLFGYVDPRSGNPSRNVILVGLLSFAGALLIGYEHAAELLNFGAFLAFMGVNAAAIRLQLLDRRGGRRTPWLGLTAAVLGFLFCLAIWLSLPLPAKIGGGAWLLAGIVYSAFRTRGFRSQPAMVDFTEP